VTQHDGCNTSLEVLDYIPCSKGQWVYEGVRQREKVISLLSKLVVQAFNLPSPASTCSAGAAPSADKTVGNEASKPSAATAQGGDAAKPKGRPKGCVLQ